MHNVVFYNSETGEILYSCQMDGRSIPIEKDRLGLEALIVEHYNVMYSETHLVINGQLVENTGAQ